MNIILFNVKQLHRYFALTAPPGRRLCLATIHPSAEFRQLSTDNCGAAPQESAEVGALQLVSAGNEPPARWGSLFVFPYAFVVI